MSKTRFQLPPRAKAAPGIDHWVKGETGTAASHRADPGTTGLFAWPKSPFLADMGAMLAAQRRNIEALTEANRIVLEAMLAVASRNVEIMHENMETARAMVDPTCPTDRAEIAIGVFESAAAHFRDLGAIIQHANIETMEVLNHRVAEALEEAKSQTRHTPRGFTNAELNRSPTGRVIDVAFDRVRPL